MNIKAPTFVVEYEKDIGSDTNDHRLTSPAFEKNHVVICQEIRKLLESRSGNIIEVGSGTGQHIVEYARTLPNLIFWPSDLRQAHLRSIEAWRIFMGPENLRPPVHIDAAQTDWELGQPDRPPSDNIAAIICSNLLHVAPWKVSEGLIYAAGKYLDEDGCLAIYGAFSRGGQHVSESNAAFHKSLQKRDPEFGVRDMDDIETSAKQNGLNLSRIIDMPSNNYFLILTRS